MAKNTTVSVRCSPEKATLWKALAADRNISLSDLISSLLDGLLNPEPQDRITPEAAIMDSVLQETPKVQESACRITPDRITERQRITNKGDQNLCDRCKRIGLGPACDPCRKANGV